MWISSWVSLTLSYHSPVPKQSSFVLLLCLIVGWHHFHAYCHLKTWLSALLNLVLVPRIMALYKCTYLLTYCHVITNELSRFQPSHIRRPEDIYVVGFHLWWFVPVVLRHMLCVRSASQSLLYVWPREDRASELQLLYGFHWSPSYACWCSTAARLSLEPILCLLVFFPWKSASPVAQSAGPGLPIPQSVGVRPAGAPGTVKPIVSMWPGNSNILSTCGFWCPAVDY